MGQEHVVVAGCGAAGYPAARAANNSRDIQVTAIDSNDFFEFKPALYGVIEGKSRQSIGFDLREHFLRAGIDFVNEPVTGIDPDAGTITTDDAQLEYDRLFVGLGGETIDFGIPRDEVLYLQDHADASRIREAAQEQDHIMIIGGGVTGVETAFTLREISPGLEITLIEAGERVASQLHAESSQIVQDRLERYDIRVRTGERIESVDDGHVVSSATEYHVDTVIQATGVRPNEVVREAFGEDGLTVDEHLQSTEYPSIFGAGDCITFQDQPKIRRAYHATKEARTGAINLLRSVHNRSSFKSYQTKEAPIVLTLGGMQGLLQTRWFTITGLIPHLMQIIGIEKRFIWKYKYLT